MIPLIRPDEIIIRTPPPTRDERGAGFHRLVGQLHLSAEVHVSDFLQRAQRERLIEVATKLLRTRILRRIYPVEIRTEFSRLEESILNCRSLSGYDAHKLLDQVAELRRTLCPVVK
jgi:hypothetical protein